MKAKKKKSLTAHRTRSPRKSSQNKTSKKPAPVNRKNKKTALKKKLRGPDKTALREAPKTVKVPTLKYYITISGKKVSLDNEIIKKYNLRAGDFLPFSRHKVFIEK